ncbi:MAG: single-stranded-DNA-specific exonuclease RecJ, partial [Bacteroidetes bacterium]
MIPKVWNPLETNEQHIQTLQKELPIHPVFCRLLIQQGIKTIKDAKTFFYPDLKKLHDPFLMTDMNTAVDRLHLAIEQNHKILLYGDYDVDGTTSVALVYTFLKSLGVQTDFYIPDRYKEGYGISFESIDYAHQNQVDLIIAMDCGIKAEKQAKAAKHYGIDLIICDHHTPGTNLPDAFAILDP